MAHGRPRLPGAGGEVAHRRAPPYFHEMPSPARLSLLVSLPVVAVMTVFGLASGCADSESAPEPLGEEDAGRLPKGQNVPEAQSDAPEEEEEVDDAATPPPEAGPPACTDTKIGSLCRPESTICCELGGCALKAKTDIRYCCLGPDKQCTFAEECCGFEACTNGKCRCQPKGQECRSNSECCTGPCNVASPGAIGTCS